MTSTTNDGWRAVVDEVVADPVRLPGVAFARIAAQAGVERRLGQDLARGDVIRMAVGPVRQRDRLRPMPANERDRLFELRRILADAPIGPPQVLAEPRAEHSASRFRFLEPDVRRAVAAHLAGGQIAQPDRQTERHVMRNRSAEADLEIVGMRTDRQEVNAHG